MGLDEIEETANHWRRVYDGRRLRAAQEDYVVPMDDRERLARAVLAMLPVVRAAENLRVVHDADERVSNVEIQQRCDCALCSAVDTLRAEMGKP